MSCTEDLLVAGKAKIRDDAKETNGVPYPHSTVQAIGPFVVYHPQLTKAIARGDLRALGVHEQQRERS